MADAELFQDKYRVASTRLPGYDYGRSEVYFVTICAAGHAPHFGTVVVPNQDWDTAFVQSTLLGQRVLAGWQSIPQFAPFALLDAFVLMPDHVHGLLLFDKQRGAGLPASYEK